MSILKNANLGLSFLLELCALAAFGYWAFEASGLMEAKIVMAVVAALLSAAIWGLLAAPRAPRRLTGWRLPAFKLLFFGLAAAALAIRHQVTLAVILAVLVIINLGLAYGWKQE